MNLTHLSFFAGMVMLVLFLWYFATDIDRRKRFVGLALALMATALSLFLIFYTGDFPENYSVLLNSPEKEVLDEETRTKAEEILRDNLLAAEDAAATTPDNKPADGTNADANPLATHASQNTIFLSRRNLDPSTVEAAVAEVREKLGLAAEITREPRPTTRIKRGIDLQGGSAFVVQLKSDAEAGTVPEMARQEAIAIFEKRLNAGGTKEPVFTPQGDDRILIQMPGVKPDEIESIRTKIQQVAKLEFRMVSPESASILARKASPDDEIIEPGWVERRFRAKDETDTPRSLVVRNRPDVEGRSVTRAGAAFGPDGWEINLSLDSEGADIFFELSKNVGQQVAILMDDEVLSAPVFREPIPGGRVRISGDFTMEEAVALASALENPLQVKPQIVDERSISATYGKNTIRQGIIAGMAGLIFTLIFVVIYYKFAGVVALVGLSINILMLLGGLALFDATLTMPGIAGIILSIGVAVDANVLIYERLREELADGRSLSAAIKGAYSKAFSAIFDANVTSLITAVILFWIASGLVKGFAVTLTLGILASLFAALLITRVCFMWLVDVGPLKRLTLRSVLPERVYDFLGKRKIALILSLAMIAVSIGVYVVRGPGAIGVDFAGGELVTIKADSDAVTEASVRDAIADLSIEKFVQSQNSPSGDRYITVRTSYDEEGSNAQLIKDAVQAKLDVSLDDLQTDSVGPVVGKELARSSAIALILGLVGILIYLTFRFEFSFALGAIIALVHDVVIVLGIIALLGYQLQLIHVGAFLTIAGYSINDTIVVFDRIRENLKASSGKADVATVMNEAISATLSRTLLTSLTTLISLGTLLIFGGPSLQDFSIAIILGIVVGTYSSIYIASPFVYWWTKLRRKDLRREILEAEELRRIDTSGIEREVPSR